MKKGIALAVFFVLLAGIPCHASKMLITSQLNNECINILIVADIKQHNLQPIKFFDVYQRLSQRLQGNGFRVNARIDEEEIMSKPYVLVLMFAGESIEENTDIAIVTYHFAKNKIPKEIEPIEYVSSDDLLEKIAIGIYQWDFISRQMNKCN